MKIKEVSERYNISISTLRYYEKVGLFKDVQRVHGIREYEDKDIERLSLILTLKKVGLTIANISTFIQLDKEGNMSKSKRIEILKNERQKVLHDIHTQQKNLETLDCMLYHLNGGCNK